MLENNPRKANTVADALSRKLELVAISRLQGSSIERIKEGLSHDPIVKSLMEYIVEGKIKRFGLRKTCSTPRGTSCMFRFMGSYARKCCMSVIILSGLVIQECIALWHLWRSIIIGCI